MFAVLPYVWMVAVAVTPPEQWRATGQIAGPSQWTAENFRTVLSTLRFARCLGNSLVAAVGTVLLSLVCNKKVVSDGQPSVDRHFSIW